jgi:murein L,D-transpeptidase YcbB/YkuD
MRRARLDQLLTGAAAAVVALALAGAADQAWAQSEEQIKAAVPATDTTLPPSPTAADSRAPAGTSSAPVIAAPEPPPAAAREPQQAKSASDSTPVIATPEPQPQPKPAVATSAPVAPAAAPQQAKTDATGTVETTTVVSADAALADRLREMSSGKFDRILGSRKERTSVEAFYSERNFAPIWVTNSAANERARAAIAYLAGVDADGLDPSDYPTPVFKAGLEPDALAEAELRLTQAVLAYARHAQTGRVHFSRLAADIDYELVRTDPADVLMRLTRAPNVTAALDSFQPPHAAYKALKKKLAEARAAKGDLGPARIANGPVLKYAKDKKGNETLMDDSRVPLLRERLKIDGDRSSTTYDKTVADAVIAFQKERKLAANGQLTTATIEALNGPRRDRDDEVIIANMERWRWVPRDLGQKYVMVNIPDYTLRIVSDDKVYWQTKIVAGKPSQATPIMTAEMKFITVNPTWNVPPSIIKNEYLPALAQDPTVLERMGLKIQQNPDGTVRIWQPPGDRNALGRIRFNFPNKFLVYQHDTPDKHLFAHERRAYSHGCMRVENPLMYGEKLLSLMLPNENYTAERLRKMFGGAEVNINFPRFLPVHLTYQTAFVDDNGKLQIREDVYGRDARLLAIMKSSERRMADVAMDRPRNTSAVPVRATPGTFGSSGAPSFFEALFGTGQPAAAPPKPRQRAARTANQQTVR